MKLNTGDKPLQVVHDHIAANTIVSVAPPTQGSRVQIIHKVRRGLAAHVFSAIRKRPATVYPEANATDPPDKNFLT
ncbi:hypothetical protein GCM10011338_19740 [Alteromonas lipolytica]|uniref:Uncharacterized protein n=1 Tax=Alteromonas lipolytica TaxID=1856405 RepID=A0A1E8FDN8_9ALTE|nr:hypothetical protein BFC17_20125 [Alteromonas lipolytica]GGF67588.1 hypothetical protein GCM10011338_19740 [Alteromonas lipolytica]